jgi:hypothetical protein
LALAIAALSRRDRHGRATSPRLPHLPTEYSESTALERLTTPMTVAESLSSKGVAMKATLTTLAALLVTTIPLSRASAQGPYQYAPVEPAGYSNPGYVAGPVASAPTGGCDSCGKPSLLAKLGLKSGGCSSCASRGCNNGLCSKCKGWLCRPMPSTAPTLGGPQYPLGFPSHPYARSPRDYFMWNDP